jgi:hypothetical protein
VSSPFRLCQLVLVLLILAPAPVPAQTRIEAPNGVAAQSITNSPITFGLKPDEQLQIIEAFFAADGSEQRRPGQSRGAC